MKTFPSVVGLFFFGLLSFAPTLPAAAVATPPAVAASRADAFEISELKNILVPMRDGVRLATNIYRPARAGVPFEEKFPVILERTPYNKDGGSAVAKIFVPRGYVVIVQDVRGRYASEGRWRPIRDDPADGFDTAKWIGEQPWSSQSIGTIGSSYGGATQHALAIAGAPHVQAMIPRNAMSDFGLYGVRHHGAFELRWLNWVLTLGNATGTPNALPAATRAAADPAATRALVDLGERVQDYARSLPLRAGTTPLKFAPDYEAWLIEAMGHGNYDAFWKDHGSSVVDHLAEYKDIPVYHVTGWYDSWGTSVANLNFVELTKAKKSLQRLIVGPWIHSSEHLDYAGEAQFTPDAALDRRRARAVRAPLRDGRRRRPQNSGRPPLRRRPLARRTRVATRAHGLHALFPPHRRHALHHETRRRAADDLLLRSEKSRAHARG
jgi:putative CocE/NonD family hydrolase